MKRLLISLFLLTTPSLAQEKNTIPFIVSKPCDHCLSDAEMKEITTQLEALIKSNDELIKKAKELEELQKANPSMELEPLVVTVDQDGRVFIKDQLKGKLLIGNLSYDVVMKLNTTVVKSKEKEYGFNLKLKASAIQNYERVDNGELKSYTSGALAIEPYYYRYFSANLVIGPRLYGPALGVDITEHFGALAGVGFLYNDDKTFFFGGAFDF